MCIFRLIMPLFFLLLLSGPALAGVVVENKDGSITSFSAGRMKTVSPGTPEVVVFNVNDSTITIINQQEKTYTTSTIKQYCGIVKAMSDEAMARMSPEEREQMAQFLGGPQNGKAPKVAVQKLGSGGEIAGYPTLKYLVTADGEKYEELYLSEKDFPVAREMDVDKLWDLSNELAECQAAGFGMENLVTVEDDPAYQELMRRGYPMKRVSYENGRPEVIDQVVSVQQKSVPESELEPPSGYRKLEVRAFSEQDMDSGMEEGMEPGDPAPYAVPEMNWPDPPGGAQEEPAPGAGEESHQAESPRAEAARSLEGEIKNKIQDGIRSLFGR